MKHCCVLITLFFSILNAVFGELIVLPTPPLDTTKTYQVELMDGSEFIGTILKMDSTSLEMKTASLPSIHILLATLKKIKLIENKVVINGSTVVPNPNPTRYFFAPSAFNLKKGEGYYQNTYLLLNSINFGLSDHFSIGASMEILSTFSTLGMEWSPIWLLTPKVGFEVVKNVNLGGGLLLAGMGFKGGFQLAYGLVTYGNTENNVTVAVSTGWMDGDYMQNPPITINGMFRMGRRNAFITENWIIPGMGSLYSYGVRFFGSKISVDLGFLNNKDIMEGILIGIPYVDFVVKF